MMNRFKEITNKDLRPLIYALVIAIGFASLIYILENAPSVYYFLFGAIVYTIFVLELYVTSNHYHIEHKAKNGDDVFDFKDHKTAQYSHHIVVPTMLYLAILMFIYFNRELHWGLISIISSLGLFVLLFENIHSFYKNNMSLNKATSYVYDLISVVVVFLVTNSVINFTTLFGLSVIDSAIILGILLVIVLSLMLLRHAITRESILLFILGLASILGVYGILFLKSINVILTAFIIAVIYAGINLIENQLAESKFTKEDVFELIIIGVLLFALLNFSNVV